MKNKAFLDTNFFINMIDPSKPYHKNANDYFEAFLLNQIELYTSTIVIAEYCVKGEVTELPLKYLKIMSFDYPSAITTGKIAKFIFDNKANLNLATRKIIPNDTKLLSQAENLNIDCFISNDNDCHRMHNLLRKNNLIHYEYFDIAVQCNINFGFLPNISTKDVVLDEFFKLLKKTNKNNP
ncbi:MAG: type II toxin-antitoxin system VapC family toxin [Cyanobacteriota bacterium]